MAKMMCGSTENLKLIWFHSFNVPKSLISNERNEEENVFNTSTIQLDKSISDSTVSLFLSIFIQLFVCMCVCIRELLGRNITK